ncbi:helix-turn-helix transcriptional regulator [Sphingobium mellinum]|uniref:helix-turn-helix transcriptional regulator n=1 Tax=Sphingobium mellinum TaxID=1387166 RepID=UPI0030EEA21A
MTWEGDYTAETTRAIRLRKVCDLTGASPATIWRWVRTEPGFPQPFHLSAAITAWEEAEVVAWLRMKKAKRGGVA